MPRSPTPPPGFKAPHREVIPVPKWIRDLLATSGSITLTAAELRDGYCSAYEAGWRDSSAHYEIEEYRSS
jgi:hypothetical protein